MNLAKAILITAVVSTFVPVVAILIRGRSQRINMLATLLTAFAVSVHLGILLRLVVLSPQAGVTSSVYALFASAVPLLLAGYLLSLGFGRGRPEESFRENRRSFVLLGLIGGVFLCLLQHRTFITGYDWAGGRGTIHIGSLGKVYLSYLLIGIVIIGYNLEKTYRVASSDTRVHLRLPLLGFFSVLGIFTFVLSTGLLYSYIGLGKLIAASLPITLATLAIAYGYLRGAITDVSAPVSRSVVYSSFTAVAAALFVLAIGGAAQVATLTHWSPDEILIITFAFLAVLIAVLLLFSNRFQRSVRRYIDRNFYVNRYDYRTQWSNLTGSIDNATNETSLFKRVVPFLLDVFAADEITIAIRDEARCSIQPVFGKGAKTPVETLNPDSPLFEKLIQQRKTLLLDRRVDDMEYIPIYAENERWLDATASRMIAPLLDGERLAGTIGLERRDRDDSFTFEDVALFDNISAHIGGALRSIRLSRELTETRETELISQWSSMLLHDLKNYLAPLRMVASNLIEYKQEPDVIALCSQDITDVTARMDHLVHALSVLRENQKLGMTTVCPNKIIRDALSKLKISRNPAIVLDLHFESENAIRGDISMLQRVFENLITNAVEAMDGEGTLRIATRDMKINGSSRVSIEVADTGKGIPEDFIRERLFRPFSTTKKKGLGLGLYQCRSITRAHGGEMRVESTPGEGTTFEITLIGAVAARDMPAAPRGEAVPNEAMS